MAATRDSPRREPRSSPSNSSSRSSRRLTSKSPGTFAFEAHQEARELAKEVGAPRLPLFYAPKRLRTYKSRGLNSFKAPNPSLTRFSLPGEREIVYPDDSPVRTSAAKRSYAATEHSEATGSPKRRKVNQARPLTPRSGAKRDFAQVEAGSDDHSPSKRQKSTVPDDDSDSDIDESLQTLSPIKKEELKSLIRECSKRSIETISETEAPTERPPLKYLVRDSKRQKSQSAEPQLVEPRTPLERLNRGILLQAPQGQQSHSAESQTAESRIPFERPTSDFLFRAQGLQSQSADSQTAESTIPLGRPFPRHPQVRRASVSENQTPESPEIRVPIERFAPSSLTGQRSNGTDTREARTSFERPIRPRVQRSDSIEAQETTIPVERTPSSYLTQRSSIAESKNSTELPSSNHIVRGTDSPFQQKEEPSSGQAEATLPARFAPVSRNRRTRAALKNTASSSPPLSPSLPTRSPEAPEAPQASQGRTAASPQPVELHQEPAAFDEQPAEPHQEPAVAPIQPQELAPAPVQLAEIPRQQLNLTILQIMMAITVYFWNIATFFPRFFASRAPAAPVINVDPANDDLAVGQDASVSRVIPGAFPTVDDTPLPLNNDTHQHSIQDDDDDWTVRYRPSNGVTDASTHVNSLQLGHESIQAIKVEKLQSKLQALKQEKLIKEQEIATKLEALKQENMAKDRQLRTIKEQNLAIKDLQKKLTDLEQVYQEKEQQNLVIKELQSTLTDLEQVYQEQEQQNLVIKELQSTLAASKLQARLNSIKQEHFVKDQQNLATRQLQEDLQVLVEEKLARQRQIESISRRNTLLETISAQHATSKRYSDQPEEWRQDDAAMRQLHHESFDANYEYEKDRILAANGYRYTTLTVEESEQCTRFATLSSPSNSARVRRTHKDPRDFFDNDDEVSLATSFARTSLAPSSRQLVSDSAECATREEEERRLEQERRREAADALLKPLGLRTPRAPVILELPGGDWARKVEATLKPGWPETGQKTKTCGPESIELGINDFKRMVPAGVWLNDSCIQAAVQYTAEHINKTAGVTLKKDTPKCVGLNSFFWPAIVSKTVPQKKRMLKRLWGLTPENFLDVESIIIPINANAHWTFLLIRPQRREIAYVDSFHSTGEDRIEGGLEFVSIFLGPLYKAEEWSRVSFEVPLQTNGYDCGMFVITNSLLLALGLDPSGYKQSDMEHQRRIIAAMILNGGWHGPFDLSKL
ncbi:hypothetical protein KJ359_010011 [Pestalotiopsis sp. 9143b]|nr:hypothetical protein KJ359_010011 [Pestalotiopsis sp. 9143b]